MGTSTFNYAEKYSPDILEIINSVILAHGRILLVILRAMPEESKIQK